LLAHEIMHKFKNEASKKAYTAIKLNIKKAYNRLEWDFILKHLQELGFHPTWDKWIMGYISPVSHSIIVNYEPLGLFSQTRGIRQGDPRSHTPLLLMRTIGTICPNKRHSARRSLVTIYFYSMYGSTHSTSQ